ncbi:hypothetical protein [Caballeronia telluris]|uniref:Uncharacterized protein n=1 Tax=Caballeronia telluris TaxID=326475 RepID=A0A158KAM9_9BURK|nr:hypothetical protein [Caballeronia telluris]SAL78177.1 hypothetical protein AWB66_05787 [Caballeronia telluris]
MKVTALIEQADRQAQLVDALLLARYALVIHDGMTLLGDDEPPSRLRINFRSELERIDAALQAAGIDTTQALAPPILDRCNDTGHRDDRNNDGGNDDSGNDDSNGVPPDAGK